MSSWSVMSAVGRYTKLDTASNYGHNFWVVFKIKYTPSLVGRFVEPPQLQWNEVIMFADHKDRNYWDFKVNMYQHKPASPTVGVWAQRYHRAYKTAKNLPQSDSGNHKGYSKLLDKNGMQVPAAKVRQATTDDDQNKAIREYLSSNGGIIEIEVHDIPSFSVASAVTSKYNQERVLVFDCGVGSGGPRVKAWQYLNINGNLPKTQWKGDFSTFGNPPGLKTTGYTNKPNLGATTPVPALPAGGVL